MPPLFSTDVSESPDETVIAVAGEIDMSTCDELRAAIEPHVDGSAAVVLDLAGVTFLDSSAIRVMIQTRDQAAGVGGSLTIRNPSELARRVLTVAGVLEVFDTPDAG